MVDYAKLVKAIPHKVHCGRGEYYEIVFASEIADGKHVGETRFEQKQIVIKSGLNPKETLTIYLHELVHLFSRQSGSKELTEEQVLSLENLFYFIIY